MDELVCLNDSIAVDMSVLTPTVDGTLISKVDLIPSHYPPPVPPRATIAVPPSSQGQLLLPDNGLPPVVPPHLSSPIGTKIHHVGGTAALPRPSPSSSSQPILVAPGGGVTPPPPLPAREPLLHGRRRGEPTYHVMHHLPPPPVPQTAVAPPSIPLHRSIGTAVVHSTTRCVGPSVTAAGHGVSTAGLEATTLTPTTHAQQQQPKLDQVIPLARWPLRTPQPETHFTLDRVLTKGPRPGNEYVDSPSCNIDGPTIVGGGAGLTERPPMVQAVVTSSSFRGDSHPVISVQPRGGGHGGIEKPEPGPVGGSGKPSPSRAAVGPGGDPATERCKEGVICSRCGKCRCANCTQRKELPRRWIGQCECSVQQAVNCCTCLCCVQACFYHCLARQDGAGGDDEISDDPCACCERPRCCLRWTIMGLLLPCLPCLCLHCPLQCTIDACTACYNACTVHNGCQCGNEASSSGGSSGTRGLLMDSESSST